VKQKTDEIEQVISARKMKQQPDYKEMSEIKMNTQSMQRN